MVLGRELEALSHSTSRGGTRHSWLRFWLQSRWWGRTWGRTGWARVDGCQHRPLPRPLPQFPGSRGKVLMIKVKDEDRRAQWVGRENKQQKNPTTKKTNPEGAHVSSASRAESVSAKGSRVPCAEEGGVQDPSFLGFYNLRGKATAQMSQGPSASVCFLLDSKRAKQAGERQLLLGNRQAMVTASAF